MDNKIKLTIGAIITFANWKNYECEVINNKSTSYSIYIGGLI